MLIADDNRDAADSLAMLLRMDGHEVSVVHDGRQAIATIDSFQPEIAVLDIGMPQLNGYEVARQVRAGPRGRLITLIAVTGWGQGVGQSESGRRGFQPSLYQAYRARCPDPVAALEWVLRRASTWQHGRSARGVRNYRPGDVVIPEVGFDVMFIGVLRAF